MYLLWLRLLWKYDGGLEPVRYRNMFITRFSKVQITVPLDSTVREISHTLTWFSGRFWTASRCVWIWRHPQMVLGQIHKQRAVCFCCIPHLIPSFLLQSQCTSFLLVNSTCHPGLLWLCWLCVTSPHNQPGKERYAKRGAHESTLSPPSSSVIAFIFSL